MIFSVFHKVNRIIKEDLEEIKRNVDFDFNKTVLVTGGAGFLGSWICDVLVKQGSKVICLDNLVSGLKSNISHLLKEPNFKFIQCDITKPIHFNENIDIVMHLASRASPFEFTKYPISILKANTLGVWVALGIAKEHKAKFLYTSTSEIYGDAKEIPTTESYRGNVNPVGVRSCYDEAKRAGESFAMAYMMEENLDVRIARIFNTYGPRMRAEGVYGRVIPRFIDQCINNKPITVFGDGSQTRSFCYVTDQVEGLLKLVFMDSIQGEVVNIGSDKEVTVLEIANLVRVLTNSDSEIVFGELPDDDPVRRKPDIGKAKSVLGWRPKVRMEDGLKRMIGHVKI